MGRILMYVTLFALAAFVLAATFLLEPTNQDVRPTEATSDDVISIHDLILTADNFRDEIVTTEGVLRAGDTDEEFLVVDSDGQGIIVQEEPHVLAPLKDQAVLVTGRFSFSIGVGVYIDALSVTAIGD